MIVADTHQIRQNVRDFIAKSINLRDVADGLNLFESGIVNSLFAVQLTNFIEKTFGFEVGMDDMDIGNFKSIDAITAFVSGKLAVRLQPG
jgi:acyl carrier protein